MIFGKHTLDETRDLLAVVDYRFKETGKAYDALEPKPADLQQDWKALSEKWATDRKNIANILTLEAIRNFPLPASAVSTEAEYKRLLDFVQFQELVKGSLQNITNRIQTLSGKQILYPNQPSQNSPDVDIELFKQLDNKTRDMDAAATAARQGAKEVVFSNWGLLIGGTLLVTVVGSQVLKKYLP